MKNKTITIVLTLCLGFMFFGCDNTGGGGGTVESVSISYSGTEPVYSETVSLDVTITYLDGTTETSTETFTATNPGEVNTLTKTVDGVSGSVDVDFEDWRLILEDGYVWYREWDQDGDTVVDTWDFNSDGTAVFTRTGSDWTDTDTTYADWKTDESLSSADYSIKTKINSGDDFIHSIYWTYKTETTQSFGAGYDHMYDFNKTAE